MNEGKSNGSSHKAIAISDMMKARKHLSHSHEETVRFGQSLAKNLRAGDVICLFGDLGTGKTTLVKGLARGLKIPASKVNSPTFVLLNVYEGKLPLFHFDFYRLEAIRDIQAIGIEEYLFGDGVSVIEWAERLRSILPKEYLEVRFTHSGEKKRLIQFRGYGERYQKLLTGMRHTRR
jgi:tRNA threonylcarbamoyladenosine biosynthesis protein TsaE